MDDNKEILELLLNTFKRMCDFIETTDGIGCIKCPCREECILKCGDTNFRHFVPMVENIKDVLIEGYMIHNFINHYFEGYYENGHPRLTPFKEDAVIFSFEDVKTNLSKLHSMGYTGLSITEE